MLITCGEDIFIVKVAFYAYVMYDVSTCHLLTNRKSESAQKLTAFSYERRQAEDEMSFADAEQKDERSLLSKQANLHAA